MRTAHTIIALMLAMAVQGQTQEQVLSEIKRQGIAADTRGAITSPSSGESAMLKTPPTSAR